jgi:hypothetical protein
MTRMVRKQIYIQLEQERLLKRRARELGVSESDIVRRGIDQVSRSTARRPVDPAAWEEAQRFIEKRLAMKVPQTGRKWTREELYDRN